PEDGFGDEAGEHHGADRDGVHRGLAVALLQPRAEEAVEGRAEEREGGDEPEPAHLDGASDVVGVFHGAIGEACRSPARRWCGRSDRWRGRWRAPPPPPPPPAR